MVWPPGIARESTIFVSLFSRARAVRFARSIGIVLAALAVGLTTACADRAADPPPLVLAAASMQESMSAAADAFSAEGHPRPVLSFAASSALARQIESGAPADLFVSADEGWMDRIEAAGRVKPGTRRDLVGNTLVLVAPASGPRSVELTAPALARALGAGRLAMADPASVPAGKYGKSALQALGLWEVVENRVANGESVRAALALVERGEAPLGVVYGTDAKASGKVRVVAAFPRSSHAPIVYPAALLSGAKPEAAAFYRFLMSPEAQTIFARYDFTDPGR
jgi:molybdate transport system substrate-binding protein